MTSGTDTFTATTRSRARSPLRLMAALCAIGVTALLSTPVVSAERLSDRDVKALLERIDDERDRFEDRLDRNLKRGIVRGLRGEVDVEHYLDDLEENVDKLKDRFTPEYAANAEAWMVLRQGSDIQRFMASQPPNVEGASEWARLTASLGDLAATYGTTMPLPDRQQAERLNDREVRTASDDVAMCADRFKRDLDSSLRNDRTVDRAAREAAARQIDALMRDAKTLASVVGAGRPASDEAKALLVRAAELLAATSGRTLSPAAQMAWGSVEAGLATVAQGFGLPRSEESNWLPAPMGHFSLDIRACWGQTMRVVERAIPDQVPGTDFDYGG